jgi:glyoxylase-like metal-dependent hydrolase (beta-lactamase superfamily II)
VKSLLPWLAALCAGAALAQARPDMARLDYDLRPRQIAERTWVIEGAVDDFSRANGCNIINTAFIATGAGVVVVNTGPSRLYGEQQRRAIERLTREPVVRVLSLNLHPDYFFGNQAWADRPTQALPGSIAGMQAEGAAYADNLYRLCGDWMKGTESSPAREPLAPQTLRLGAHTLELRRLSGHTGDDLVLIDTHTGVLFAGGLVFAARQPGHARAMAGRGPVPPGGAQPRPGAHRRARPAADARLAALAHRAHAGQRRTWPGPERGAAHARAGALRRLGRAARRAAPQPRAVVPALRAAGAGPARALSACCGHCCSRTGR